MFKASITLATLSLLAFLAGCHSDRPHEYGEERPPIGQLTPGDTGLQSKDVVDASDQLAMDLLALPELNASREQWTVVVDRVENYTTDPRFNYDIFIERLRINLARHGRGRITLIENKQRFHDLQARELEGGGGSNFGQGGGAAAVGSAGIQPDYILYGKIMELPNRRTSYYLAEFNVTNLKTRVQHPFAYDVKVARD